MLTVKELRSKGKEELQTELSRLRLSLSRKQSAVRLGQDKKNHEVGQTRKTIARILTILKTL